ncbi:MAG: hypothetical protein JWN86_171 [Planctomycetota bacterium]|nr:hypothetical protein [Planctomycetota bacterium]
MAPGPEGQDQPVVRPGTEPRRPVGRIRGGADRIAVRIRAARRRCPDGRGQARGARRRSLGPRDGAGDAGKDRTRGGRFAAGDRGPGEARGRSPGRAQLPRATRHQLQRPGARVSQAGPNGGSRADRAEGPADPRLAVGRFPWAPSLFHEPGRGVQQPRNHDRPGDGSGRDRVPPARVADPAVEDGDLVPGGYRRAQRRRRVAREPGPGRARPGRPEAGQALAGAGAALPQGIASPQPEQSPGPRLLPQQRPTPDPGPRGAGRPRHGRRTMRGTGAQRGAAGRESRGGGRWAPVLLGAREEGRGTSPGRARGPVPRLRRSRGTLADPGAGEGRDRARGLEGQPRTRPDPGEEGRA